MEPRAAVGDFDTSNGDFTLYTTSQNPHVIRLLMGAFVLHIPENKLRVVAPDVGGGFGSKIYHYAEERSSPARRQPVQAGEMDRRAQRKFQFLLRTAATTSRPAEMAIDKDGHFLALRAHAGQHGRLPVHVCSCVPTYLYATLLAGVYKTPVIYAEVKAIFTNTVPVDAYRGAGRPEATFLLERLVDAVAHDTGIDRVDLRRRNFIPNDAFPYQTPVALQYDSGNYTATLDGAIARPTGFEARRKAAASRGKLRGIGVSTYLEACGIAPSAVVGSLGARAGLYEVANIKVHPTGSVTVYTGSHSHGQGHETTFAQLVASQLGVPMDQVDIVHGDTAKIPWLGMGTYGSRSLAVGGSAMVKAMELQIIRRQEDRRPPDGKLRRRHRSPQDNKFYVPAPTR